MRAGFWEVPALEAQLPMLIIGVLVVVVFIVAWYLQSLSTFSRSVMQWVKVCCFTGGAARCSLP